MSRKIMINVVLAMALLIGSYSNVFANEVKQNSTEKIWDKYKDVQVQRDKIWTITFNNKVLESDELDKHVYVLDKQGNKVDVSIELNEEKIVITPIKNYIADNSYTLIVDGELKSEIGKSLGHDIVMPFVIENNIAIAVGKVKSEIILLAEEIELSQYKISRNEIQEVMDSVINNTPEIFYYDGITYYYDSTTDIIEKIKVNYLYSAEKIEEMKVKLWKKIEKILNETIDDKMNDYQKELAIHDYIINNTVYDVESLNGKGKDYVYGMYGTLIEGRAVCSGYAKTMQYFLNKFHIDNKLIFGTAKGISHVWNQVNVNGDLYNVDVTFDDPVVDAGDKLRWNYFNVTDEVLSSNHEWDKSQALTSDGVNENYFRKNNLMVNNTEDAKKLLEKLMNNNVKKIDFWFQTNLSGIKNLMTETNYVGTYSYSYDEDAFIVSIELK